MYNTEQSSPPRTFDIIQVDINSLQLTWSTPENPNGIIDYYTVRWLLELIPSYVATFIIFC